MTDLGQHASKDRRAESAKLNLIALAFRVLEEIAIGSGISDNQSALEGVFGWFAIKEAGCSPIKSDARDRMFFDWQRLAVKRTVP